MVRKIQSTSSNQIRIICGKWRGRKLPVVDSDGLRPTTNRIRETLFNWLMPVIQQARCLDCFAGSGALAIEALSRYAASATLIELERYVATQLASNLDKLEAKNAQVINSNTLNYLSQAGTTYDVIFLDPPFGKDLLQQTALLLEHNGWLSENCWIYVETETDANLAILPKTWQLYRKKFSGKVAYCLYIRNQ
ncbi:16S rRNA (guanine(966)-N(2))-methyltransferase [Arsenophonus endosymbiont of Aleurodicus dispersus]|uniref:16S rRNA (guanine(966)-N(2))-methyltransferase n=1 Tax=Arsenophonus endosymbiont of Aleurodicus dispersus TaxID=235559 RepID=UPI000EB51F04|nr:16S rRNA (guanine(966)-N(2))-methyltransferase [Arsenophonus endosymbiont of Aleurodicus dispersus]